MSILDRMTDADLKALVASKDDEIKTLQALCKYYREDRDRLYKFSQAKTKRIVSLTEELNFINKGLGAANGMGT